jgi:hypothetical protein
MRRPVGVTVAYNMTLQDATFLIKQQGEYFIHNTNCEN